MVPRMKDIEMLDLGDLATTKIPLQTGLHFLQKLEGQPES